MKIKGVVAEDFCNYKKPSMFISTASCDWKCCIEQGLDIRICQNEPLNSQPTHEISDDVIISAYLHNDITKAIVFGGLEPFRQFEELQGFIQKLRNGYDCTDDIVIYTGYYPYELEKELEWLSNYPNIIVKFGRFIPGHQPHYDSVLGVNLISDNQYAEQKGSIK